MVPFFQKSKYNDFFTNVKYFSNTEVATCEQMLELFNKISTLNTSLIKENSSFWREVEADQNSRLFTFND